MHIHDHGFMTNKLLLLTQVAFYCGFQYHASTWVIQLL